MGGTRYILYTLPRSFLFLFRRLLLYAAFISLSFLLDVPAALTSRSAQIAYFFFFASGRLVFSFFFCAAFHFGICFSGGMFQLPPPLSFTFILSHPLTSSSPSSLPLRFFLPFRFFFGDARAALRRPSPTHPACVVILFLDHPGAHPAGLPRPFILKVGACTPMFSRHVDAGSSMTISSKFCRVHARLVRFRVLGRWALSVAEDVSCRYADVGMFPVGAADLGF